MLLRRNEPHDGERARTMLEQAFATASELEMATLADEITVRLDAMT
jgi:hypothetical protein